MQSSLTFHDTDRWFIFQNDHLLLIKTDDKYTLPATSFYMEIKSSLLRQPQLVGPFNHVQCYCAEIDKNILLPDTIARVTLRVAFEVLEEEWYHAMVRAWFIITWDKNTQYCGRCGSKTLPDTGSFHEHVCPVCGLFFYPRISPSVIVRIKRDDQILMARSPHFTPGVYGLIAGFVEIGESLEDAVRREVREEVNLEIDHLQYFGSQPWPFPDSLVIAFTADYVSGEIMIDQREIESAGWYRVDNMPGKPSSRISIAKRLIDHFIEEQKK